MAPVAPRKPDERRRLWPAAHSSALMASPAWPSRWFRPSRPSVFMWLMVGGTARTNVHRGRPDRPDNAYGRSKVAGERAVQSVGAAHLILRTSWIYATRGKNFLLTIARLARENEDLRIVDDQIGSPTWARLVAEATAQILARSLARGNGSGFALTGGLYHLAAQGATSWHGFATAIVDHLRARGDRDLSVRRVIAIRSREFPTAARRPSYSVLDCSAATAAFSISLPDWRHQVALCLRG